MFKDEKNLYLATIETTKAELSDTIILKQGLENVLSNAFSRVSAMAKSRA
jgi:hypothetical protein